MHTYVTPQHIMCEHDWPNRHYGWYVTTSNVTYKLLPLSVYYSEINKYIHKITQAVHYNIQY